LPHVIAGSVEASFAVLAGHASGLDYLLRFLLPTLIGNTIGGVPLLPSSTTPRLHPSFRRTLQIEALRTIEKRSGKQRSAGRLRPKVENLDRANARIDVCD